MANLPLSLVGAAGGGGVNLDKPVVIYDGTETSNVNADLSDYKIVKIYIVTPYTGAFGAYCKVGESCSVGGTESGAANIRVYSVDESGVHSMGYFPDYNGGGTLIKKVEAFT